jgi:hypothetical protein
VNDKLRIYRTAISRARRDGHGHVGDGERDKIRAVGGGWSGSRLALRSDVEKVTGSGYSPVRVVCASGQADVGVSAYLWASARRNGWT